ncbi:MAG: ferritin-like domain-containing protein, partial [Planctomycetes bacterium]|nr:ferritin-like domain-containing protein [Planctomycetota bacterium]
MRSAVVEALTLATDQAPPLRIARTSAEWVAYFRANAARVLDVPWHDGAGAAPPAVVASLRA